MTRHIWTSDEIATVRRLYADLSAADCADHLGLSIKQVQHKAHKLGLKKSPEWIAERSRAAMQDESHPAHRSRFTSGHATWNKGISFDAGGRSAETQFKHGQRPHTWNPIGHERLTKEGYLQRKVSDTGVTRRDYVAVHRLVWIEHNGPAPAGYAVVFRDGNNRNFDIDNLELVSRADLMARNTVHRLPKEVSLAVQMLGALRRKINEQESRHANHG